ncbi:MAG: linear amide C-N hydrolase [Candidatus Obscuribacterales bacterium]|nr:linear amide C-N hydrolase [Candidatus Obscuribacterales bacterium]
MFKKSLLNTGIIFMAAGLSMQSSDACTELLLNKSKGLVISGRTLDYNCEMGSKICFRQKGTEQADPGLKFTTLKGEPLKWKTKYSCVLVDAFDEPAFVDGMNTEGLSVACLWHADTEPALEIAPGTNGLASVSLVEYLLENAATVEEAKKLVEKLSLFLSKYQGEAMTLHWIVTERTGKSTVIELKNGKPKFFDEVEKVGVMTNQPSYDRQLENLKSHEDESKNNPNYNLPGDYQSKSRFVKTAYLVSHLPEIKTADEGVAAARQILHNVEAPKGAQKTGSYTQWLALRDQSNLRYWLIGVNHGMPKFIDLKSLDFKQLADKKIPVDSADGGNVMELVNGKPLHTLSSN